MSEDATNNEIELNHDGDNEAADNDDADKSKERKHDCGAADLEKVTDYAEEKEIVAASTALLDDAIATVRQKQAAELAERRALERELAKVSIKKEDVDLIAEEMEISKTKAERTLREHQGNVVEALASLTN